MNAICRCNECGTEFENDDGSKMDNIDVIFSSHEIICSTCGRKMKDEVSAAKDWVIDDILEEDTRFEFRCMDCGHWLQSEDVATMVKERVCPVCGGHFIDLEPFEGVD